MSYSTKDIIEQFNISKPTLNSWIKKGLISAPHRDWRGWRLWEESNVNEISTVIREKQEQYSVGV